VLARTTTNNPGGIARGPQTRERESDACDSLNKPQISAYAGPGAAKCGSKSKHTHRALGSRCVLALLKQEQSPRITRRHAPTNVHAFHAPLLSGWSVCMYGRITVVNGELAAPVTSPSMHSVIHLLGPCARRQHQHANTDPVGTCTRATHTHTHTHVVQMLLDQRPLVVGQYRATLEQPARHIRVVRSHVGVCPVSESASVTLL